MELLPSNDDVAVAAEGQATIEDRLDLPGVIEEGLLLGSVLHAHDAQLLKHLHVSYLLDMENPRKRDTAKFVAVADPAVELGRVELDDDFAYATFKERALQANDLIQQALEQHKTVFVFCTHGNNESVVGCITYLMLTAKWTLERAYKHVLQKRPASAPRRAYIEQLRILELEYHGSVTLRLEQVGPSMIDLMMRLRGETTDRGTVVSDDVSESGSQATEGGESTIERASFVSNFSVATGLHNGSSLRETMIIAEQEEEASNVSEQSRHNGAIVQRRTRTKQSRGSCVIS